MGTGEHAMRKASMPASARIAAYYAAHCGISSTHGERFVRSACARSMRKAPAILLVTTAALGVAIFFAWRAFESPSATEIASQSSARHVRVAQESSAVGAPVATESERALAGGSRSMRLRLDDG